MISSAASPEIPCRAIPARSFAFDLLHALLGSLEAERAPQLLGFSAGEARRHHRHAQQLLLEQRHAERPRQDRLERRMRVLTGSTPLPPLQVRMHHLPDDRAGPDDRDLDDDVVEPLRTQPRQRRHLRARLDLEDPDRVGLLQHPVDGGVVGGKMGKVDERRRDSACSRIGVLGFADRRVRDARQPRPSGSPDIPHLSSTRAPIPSPDPYSPAPAHPAAPPSCQGRADRLSRAPCRRSRPCPTGRRRGRACWRFRAGRCRRGGRGTSPCRRSAGRDGAADPGSAATAAEQLDRRVVEVEADLAQVALERLLRDRSTRSGSSPSPADRLASGCDRQRLADFARGAAAAIRDDVGGHRHSWPFGGYSWPFGGHSWPFG